MRISDLASSTGVPVATIKFYLRQGLLPKGVPTARNQADYGEAHVRRIKLIRILLVAGRLDLVSIGALLGVIDDDKVGVDGVYEVLNASFYHHDLGIATPGGTESTCCEVDDFLGERGWPDARSPAGNGLSEVLAALRSLGCEADVNFFRPFAEAAEKVTTAEFDLLDQVDHTAQKGSVVMRYVLFEAAFAAMHRLAREAAVSRRYAGPPACRDRTPATHPRPGGAAA